MKEIEVGVQQALLLIGMLTAIRVKCDSAYPTIKENRVYPLNQAQITKFTESLLLKYHDTPSVSAWDLYNAATDLYKADSMVHALYLFALGHDDVPGIYKPRLDNIENLRNRDSFAAPFAALIVCGDILVGAKHSLIVADFDHVSEADLNAFLMESDCEVCCLFLIIEEK